MSKKNYILIIDDNEDHLYILRKILEANNYNVDTVSNYEDVFTHLTSFRYDIVLLDIVLKDKNGIELLNELIEVYPTLTVIVMSAFGDDQEIVTAIKEGAIDYITKNPGFESRILDSIQKNIEHKNLKNEISTIQKQYEQLFEVANDFMFTLDLNGNFTRFNGKFKEFFGANYTKQLMGKSFFNLIPDGHRDEIIMSFNSILFEAVEPKLIKLPLTNDRDETIDFEINSTVLKDFEKTTGVLCVARDVTKTNQLLEKEKELEIRLMEKHQLALIGKMIHGIAHNINTPLATIIGLSELLQLKDPESKNLRTINEQGLIISEIIKNMSRKVQNESSDNIELWDLNYIIKEELEFFTGDNIFKHHIVKNIDLQVNLPRINIRYQDFSQSFDAIVENAIEAMEQTEEKILEVKTYEKKNYIFVEINNTGKDFETNNLKELFSPFYTTKHQNRDIENLGLGLYNAKSLLKPYAISIDVKRLKKMTKFILKIPLNDT